MRDNPPVYRIKKIIEFNPAWLDEDGFMTNLPGPDFLSSLNLPEGKNVAIGVYPVVRTFQGRRPDDEELQHFMITHTRVEQELRFDRKAIISNDRLIIESKSTHAREEVREPFLTPEGKKIWCLCGETRFHRVDPPLEFVPATMAVLFFQLDIHLQRAWDFLTRSEQGTGHKKWAFPLYQPAMHPANPTMSRLDARAAEDAWKTRPTGKRERELWLAVRGYTAGILNDPRPSDELQVERKEQILHFVSQALALKEAV